MSGSGAENRAASATPRPSPSRHGSFRTTVVQILSVFGGQIGATALGLAANVWA
ncbi:MAG: hypothetical protein HOP29_03165, partial [Phycisphaerales bacterium]|nr:hypothetical protein [Phycisphaerales bacterium]